LCSQNFSELGILVSSPNSKTNCTKRATTRRQILTYKMPARREYKIKAKLKVYSGMDFVGPSR